jgi:methionyl-tRNA synthetase
MSQLGLHLVLSAIWQVVAEANRYFASQEPWALRTRDPERMATVLYVTAEAVRQAAVLVQPIMPAAAARLLDLVAVPKEARSFAALGEAGRLKPGTPLPPAEPVFPRYIEKAAGAAGG